MDTMVLLWPQDERMPVIVPGYRTKAGELVYLVPADWTDTPFESVVLKREAAEWTRT